jgi:hypothetical protein
MAQAHRAAGTMAIYAHGVASAPHPGQGWSETAQEAHGARVGAIAQPRVDGRRLAELRASGASSGQAGAHLRSLWLFTRRSARRGLLWEPVDQSEDDKLEKARDGISWLMVARSRAREATAGTRPGWA